jgi:Tfp pilus assembly protein PilF
VQGADLATVLKQEGVLPIPRTLRYITQIVGGLVAAHEAGVVHRDLKPANIMIDEDDSALIMDFGIAHSSSAAGTGAEKVVGTLAYMAPEQAQAKPTDQRADVYALGMMLREMLIGRKTGGDGQQALAELMARIKEAPPRLRTIDETIPEPLDELAARCLEPDPADRFQSSGELAAALAALDENGQLRPIEKPVLSPWRMTVAAVLVIATLGTAAIVWRRTVPAAAPKPIDPVSILVADFDNKTGDPVFDGALEQPLTLEMETASFIQALSRTDAKQQAQAINGATRLDDATARLIAFRQSTGARATYVLAGSVFPKDRGYTLELRALDPSNGAVLKAVSADAKTKADVLGAVSTLAGRLRTALGDKTVNANKTKPTETFTAGSLEAFREYTTAQDLQLARHDAEAAAHYRRAVELDPKFGRAYSGLAVSEQRLGNNDEAEAAWKTALSLTDRMTDREKYRTYGNYYLGVTKNYEKAVEQFSALVAAYPADDAGFGNLGLSHFYLRDFTKAMAEARRAVAMNPKNILQRNNLALYAMYAGDFATAAAEARQVIADQGATASTFLPLVMEAVANGDIAAATAAYDGMATKTDARGASLASLGRGDLALYGGRLDAAAAELKSGLSADTAAKNTAAAALKQVTLAEDLLEAGHKPQAAAAAQAALADSRQPVSYTQHPAHET